MKYYFRAVVEEDGSILLSGLPPQKEVEIIVRERRSFPEEMQRWLDDIRERHPFAKMSKEEILEVLRKTREIIAQAK